MRTVLDMDGDECKIIWMLLIPLCNILKNGQDGTHCYTYFTRLKKKNFKCQITQHQAEKKSYGNQTKEPQT